MNTLDSAPIEHAADLIENADALLVGAGAGMGIDSGLPDFRGPGGFWRAYPALGRRGLEFYQVASPRTFAEDPRLAWGFYGHRLDLYRRTAPHAGFALLKRWGERTLHGYGVYTSNVDGHFQRAGFDADAIAECHGSIHRLQCTRACSDATWPADDFVPEVDAQTCTLTSELPICPHCGALARPNILMFGDAAWQDMPSAAQEAALGWWLDRAQRIVIVEVGAGTAIPSVRHYSHRTIIERGARLIRINPREPAVPGLEHVSITQPGLAALMAIERAMGAR
jgi:NAD-dependent SIR2 family protein deacetylase